MCVCVFIKLHITAQSGPVIPVFYATRIDPPKGGSMIFVTKCVSLCVCLCVCGCVWVCVFIKLHITAQSGLVILVILCPSH